MPDDGDYIRTESILDAAGIISGDYEVYDIEVRRDPSRPFSRPRFAFVLRPKVERHPARPFARPVSSRPRNPARNVAYLRALCTVAS